MRATIYSKPNCIFCDRAKDWFRDYGIPYIEYDVTNKDNLNFLKMKIPGVKTVPQIFLDNDHIGGYSELLDRQHYVWDKYKNDT